MEVIGFLRLAHSKIVDNASSQRTTIISKWGCGKLNHPLSNKSISNFYPCGCAYMVRFVNKQISDTLAEVVDGFLIATVQHTGSGDEYIGMEEQFIRLSD